MAKRRRRGSGSVIARADGTFSARVSLGVVDGVRRRRERKGFRSRAEALVELGEMLGTAGTDDRTPLGEYLPKWLAGVSHELAPGSVRAYALDIRHIDPVIGGVPVGRLTPRHVRNLIADRLAAGVAPSRVRRIVTVLGRALESGVADGTLQRNVAARQRIRQSPHEPFVLTAAAARKLLAAIKGDRHEAAWTLALLTGLRRGELLGLTWADVDLERASLTVRRQLSTTGTREPKQRSRRTIPLPGLAVAALRKHRGDRIVKPADRIFRVAPATLTHAWGRTVIAAGLPPCRLHDLRHGAASLMLATGTPIRVIADTLGHADPAITARVYAHLTQGLQVDAAERLDAALREKR